MARNARMLEETRDTITIPASYMIRMLASMTRFWQGIPFLILALFRKLLNENNCLQITTEQIPINRDP